MTRRLAPRLLFNSSTSWRARLLLALALEIRADLWTKLLEVAALRAFLVRVVERFDVGLRGGWRALLGFLLEVLRGEHAGGLGGLVDEQVADEQVENVAAVLIKQLSHARIRSAGSSDCHFSSSSLSVILRPPSSATTVSGVLC